MTVYIGSKVMVRDVDLERAIYWIIGYRHTYPDRTFELMFNSVSGTWDLIRSEQNGE